MSLPVIIVTGAAGNVGRALLTVLAPLCDIVAVDRSAEALAPLLAALPRAGAHHAIGGADLLDPAGTASVVAAATARYGRLDGLAHTVGGFEMADAAESGRDIWERMFRINTLSTVLMVQAVLGPMTAARAGAIVAIAAGAGVKAPAGLAAYAASKAAILRLIESYGDELKPAGVRVNAVMPGTIDTPQNRAAMPDADPARWVTPAEVAAAIAFLLSPAASGITGAALPVPGRG